MYAERGWRVHPLRPGRKDPATRRGCLDATTDRDRLARYWTARPTANIGIATGPDSGLWVLDVDGPEGRAALAELEAFFGSLPTTYAVRTGRDDGGAQLYWRFPMLAPGYRLANSQGRIGRHLDVRADGGYVVAPPSIHPSGRAYAVAVDAELANAPAWLLGLAITRPPAPPSSSRRPLPSDGDSLSALQRAALESGGTRILLAGEGERNRTLNREAHGLARCRVPRELAEYVLKNAAIAAGLTPVETAKTFESGWQAGLRAPELARRYGR